ncbi:hypothetical protein QYF36_018274 [Acer negundo]|nr:hypothetical protein QYF36_018274 [Acer negundo]
MDPIVDYLQSDTLLADPDQACKLKRIATRYYLLRCLHPNDATWALGKVHSGDYVCSIMRGLPEDSKPPSPPPERLSSINTPYPFVIWGLNLIGPLSTAPKKTTNFVKENIVCRFGTPMAIITDLGKQFDNANFREFYKDRNIDLRFASVAHPQTNGLVEATNKTIKKLLKKNL